jgi:hypothetical protein
VRRAFFAIIGAAAVALSACGSITSAIPTVQVTLASGDEAFEAAYNGAANAYLANQATMPAATKAQAKALLLKALSCTGTPPICTGYVTDAHNAALAGNAALEAAAAGNVTAVATQVQGLIAGNGVTP